MTVSDDFDPLDELASAHLDGEPLPDDVAATTPADDLDARVASLRAVSELLAGDLPRPDPQLRSAHLAAALGAFDQLGLGSDSPVAVPDPTLDSAPSAGSARAAGPDPSTGSDPVVTADPSTASDPVVTPLAGWGGAELATIGPSDLDRSEPDVSPSVPSGRAGGGAIVTPIDARSRRRGPAGRWLGAAAAAVVIVAAAGLAIASLGENASEETTAAAPLPADGEEGAANESDMAELDAAGSAAAPADAAGSDSAATRMDDGSPATTTFGDESVESADDTDTVVPADPSTPAAAFDRVPSVREMEGLADTSLLALDQSVCGNDAEPGADGGPPVGFVPVTIAGEPAEILVYLGADGRSFVVVDGSCAPLP